MTRLNKIVFDDREYMRQVREMRARIEKLMEEDTTAAAVQVMADETTSGTRASNGPAADVAVIAGRGCPDDTEPPR